nr:hypothetical protein [Tanacetum cinerariifolium]
MTRSTTGGGTNGCEESLGVIPKALRRRSAFTIERTSADAVNALKKLVFCRIKGKVDEVFGTPLPKDLITDAIQNSEYFKKYSEMVARKSRKPTTMTNEEGRKKKKALEA